MARCLNSANPWAATLLALAAILPAAGTLHAADGDVFSQQERSHWSLQPRSMPAIRLPASGAAAAWLANPVDAFIVARLERAGLHPSPLADRRTLIRRLYFNLLGLPPSLEAME